MRNYTTPAAFRAAVEAKLRDRTRRVIVPPYILRRQAALERLIVRLGLRFCTNGTSLRFVPPAPGGCAPLPPCMADQ